MGDRQAEREQRVTPLELFFDLVFVFAFTQVTTFLSHSPTWGGLLRALLLLGMLWWAWSAFVWAANAQSAASPTLRACLLVSSVAIFISGLSIPHAFGSEATLFAPLVALTIFLGVYPAPVLEASAAAISTLIKGYDTALGETKTAALFRLKAE